MTEVKNKKQKILIATGVYPPEAGGPAYYAQSLKEEFEKLGHTVTVSTFTIERSLPTGIRHLVFFFKTLPIYILADWTIVLDTFSVAFPVAILRAFFGGVTVVRTGGDFLWEEYVERTKEKILLSKFYEVSRTFTLKEKIIFLLTRWVLARMDYVVFSTMYQRDIWEKPYAISSKKISVVENRYGKANEPGRTFSHKNFVYCAARDLVWKNTDTVREAFVEARNMVDGVTLEFLFDMSRETALQKIKDAYACVLCSLGDISPNYILRALSYGKPVILTQETGLRDRLSDTVLFVDPLDAHAIAEKIVWLADEKNYLEQKKKTESFSFMHTYADIAREILSLIQR